ncbi:MAG TPA: hypothetical protein RMG45_02405, partial [Polyangiaceae bacterium LLY-WYZ-15_(1-7)]|nr:hypothetical protein [Polyangiaceae bacterium LLY-WYZ-15_(1-7)]
PAPARRRARLLGGVGGEEREPQPNRRAATVLGWLAGGGGALLLNFGLYHAWGTDYPVQPTSFVLFVVGAFGGMALADRLGERAFRVLGIATGVVFALGLTAFVLLGGF